MLLYFNLTDKSVKLRFPNLLLFFYSRVTRFPGQQTSSCFKFSWPIREQCDITSCILVRFIMWIKQGDWDFISKPMNTFEAEKANSRCERTIRDWFTNVLHGKKKQQQKTGANLIAHINRSESCQMCKIATQLILHVVGGV